MLHNIQISLSMLKFLHFISTILIVFIAFSTVIAGDDNVATDKQQIEIQLFPNPVTNGELTIHANLDIDEIQIVNILGQPVFEEKMIQNENIRLDISHLEKGIFLVQIKLNNGETKTTRVLVK